VDEVHGRNPGWSYKDDSVPQGRLKITEDGVLGVLTGSHATLRAHLSAILFTLRSTSLKPLPRQSPFHLLILPLNSYNRKRTVPVDSPETTM